MQTNALLVVARALIMIRTLDAWDGMEHHKPADHSDHQDQMPLEVHQDWNFELLVDNIFIFTMMHDMEFC